MTETTGEKLRRVTLDVTDTQLALINAVIGKDTDAIADISDKSLSDIFEDQARRRLEATLYRNWEVTRNVDAYVRHTAVIRARTEDEAMEILGEKRDALFDLTEEGDVITFDDIDYNVESVGE